MDAATIAAKVSYGLGKAASVIGRPYSLYRPTSGVVAALDPSMLVGSVPAAVDTCSQFEFRQPVKPGQFLFYLLADVTTMLVGDYLVGPEGTFFLATRDDIDRPLLVRCNRVLTLSRPSGSPPGPGYYGGDVTATETPLLNAWPAAVITKTRGEGGDTNLPGDTREPWMEVMLPASVPLQICFADVALDEQASQCRYVFSSTEQTALGWRCLARVVLV